MPRRRDLDLLREIGVRIRALRSARGWTQEQLAARARLQASAVSRIESGELGFTLSTGAVLARALGVSYARFFAESAHDPLAVEERLLLDAWRRLPRDRREVVLSLIDWCGAADVRYVAESRGGP
jgi:transcriptional regulator with XRE-family HTH domain